MQITVEETLGIGHRGSFYDAIGALRDMVPNHLFQLLSLIAMEPPAHFEAHSVRSEKGEVLAAIQAQSEEERSEIRIEVNIPSARLATQLCRLIARLKMCGPTARQRRTSR
jgi:glucose-6-phosphate 1-dehydrogenase